MRCARAGSAIGVIDVNETRPSDWAYDPVAQDDPSSGFLERGLVFRVLSDEGLGLIRPMSHRSVRNLSPEKVRIASEFERRGHPLSHRAAL